MSSIATDCGARKADCLLPLCLAMAVLAILPPLFASSAVSLLLFFIFILSIIWMYFTVSLKYIVYLFAMCTNVIGVAVCEFSHTFLPELQCVSEFSGSLPLLIFSRSLFILIIVKLDQRTKYYVKIEEKHASSKIVKTILGLACFMVLFLCIASFINVARNPAFLSGMDRFQYSGQLLGIWGSIAAYLPYLILISVIGMRFGFRKIAIATIAIYCIFLFWIGTKFSTFFTMFGYFALVYHDKLRDITPHNKLKVLASIATVLAMLVAFAVFAYSVAGHSAVGFLGERLAQQGQLWWKTYSMIEPGVWFDEKQASVEMGALFENRSISESVGSVNGIYGIMYLTAPASRVSEFLSQGARYTEAGYAMAYVIAGSIGPVLFAAVMALFVYYSQTILASSIFRSDVAFSIIFAILAGYVQTSNSMFVFSQFFTPMGLVIVALSFLYALINSAEKHRLSSGGQLL
ncbi:hypothetical protein I7648_10630 [Collinsella tanakaei]|nr:hypothetical protein [Collinsella tanakaei]